MANNAITTIADMQIVPEKFSAYVTERTTEKSAMVNSGIASGDATVASLINGTPNGGRFITIPSWQPLDASIEEDVFGEDPVSVAGITTGDCRATLLIRQKAWGDSDLAHVLGGADPMGAIVNQMADWRNQREQKIYLAELKAILDPSNGALKAHVNDISTGSGDAAFISEGATLETKQALGDAHTKLSMVFMHSAVYTYLQKNGMITRNPIFDPSQSAIEMERYLGYRIIVDDGMPVNNGVYDTFILGQNAFIRQDGMPAGLVGTETDRDKMEAKNYLINRWCQVIAPRGFSWVPDETTTLLSGKKYPGNTDLAAAANWKLATHHKNVPIVCLRHKIG